MYLLIPYVEWLTIQHAHVVLNEFKNQSSLFTLSLCFTLLNTFDL